MPMLDRENAALPEIIGSQRSSERFDILCFSHLRWDFVFQRPQHLLSRAAQAGRVFYVEEPIVEEGAKAFLRSRIVDGGVVVLQPILPAALLSAGQTAEQMQRDLLRQFVHDERLQNFVSWYYTPMALAFTAELQPLAVVYDCMDELSAFRGAPPELLQREQELLDRADVVFTGGASLFESKRHRHANVHLFASSVDVAHFAQARDAQADPADQQAIAHPRVGFYGVLDERLDLVLLRDLARLRPATQFVMLGPLAKLGEHDLPRAENLHYLGPKSYAQLPAYLSGWDAAMLPFALNESTRFISPTKTPEYLAAHRHAVSTPIRDVVTPYGEEDLVAIADSPEAFALALDQALKPPEEAWLRKVDARLALNSWQQTWEAMQAQVAAVLLSR